MSTTFDGPARAVKPAGPQPPAQAAAPPEVATPAAAAATWGNSAPLALAAFAVPTLMLSAVNIGWVSIALTPMIFAVALVSGGIVQLIAGIIQLRTGNTFTGVLFSMFAALWLSLFAFAEFFEGEIPLTERGHALGLLLFAFGAFTLWVFVASFRTNVVVVTALALLAATLFLLGAGKYGANIDLVKAAGWLGLIAAAEAAYLSCAELCQAAYKREILPVGPLAK
jgi:uncharacterized protein